MSYIYYKHLYMTPELEKAAKAYLNMNTGAWPAELHRTLAVLSKKMGMCGELAVEACRQYVYKRSIAIPNPYANWDEDVVFEVLYPYYCGLCEQPMKDEEEWYKHINEDHADQAPLDDDGPDFQDEYFRSYEDDE